MVAVAVAVVAVVVVGLVIAGVAVAGGAAAAGDAAVGVLSRAAAAPTGTTAAHSKQQSFAAIEKTKQIVAAVASVVASVAEDEAKVTQEKTWLAFALATVVETKSSASKQTVHFVPTQKVEDS